MNKISYRLKRIWLSLTKIFRKNYTANTCGHRTKLQGTIRSFSKDYSMSMPLNKNGSPDYCLECIGKMAIRCAWCGENIVIGDAITLYIPDESYKVPNHAVRYLEDPRALVGCLRWDCARTGAERAGFWIPPGTVKRVLSPIELLMSSSSPNGHMVIVSDLSDQNNTGKIVSTK